MKNILDSFFKSKMSLGCDIGSSSCKFVGLERTKEGIIVDSLGMIETSVLGENSVCLQRAAAFFTEKGISGKHAAVNIEDKTMRIRRMDLPEMPEGDLKIAISWNFREYVDGPIEKFLIDHTKIEGVASEGGKKAYMAYAVAGEAVERIVKLAAQMGIRPSSVEPNATALLSAYDSAIGGGRDFDVMIDFSSCMANFVVIGNSCLLFSRPIPAAGYETLAKNISKELAVTQEQGLALLKQYAARPDDPTPNSEKIKAVTNDFLSQTVIDIQRSIDAFCIMFHADKVSTIYISGGGSLLPGLSDYITKNLGVSAKMFDPFARVDISAVGKVNNPQLYTIAMGLAIPRD